MAKQGEAADLRIGVCDWSLGGAGNLESLKLAAKAGLEGVQISPAGAGDKLSFCSDKVRDDYRQAVKDTGMQIASVGLAITNEFPLASDPRGPAWLEQAIDTAAAMGCRPILLAFFGNGDLLDAKTGQLKAKDVDAVVERLKAAAPHAKDKGVVLALESWLPAKDTVAILDRVNSPAVQMYYDIANSSSRGYDVPAEIRSLKGRIAEFHFKDNKGLFGAGQVDVPPIAKAITEVGYKGWLILEQHHGPDAGAYFRQNADYVRKVFGLKAPGGKAE